MIKAVNSVTVIDAKTGDDFTAFVLTQIVLKEAKKKNALLPAELLHMIILYGDNILGEFFDKYPGQTLKNYLVYRGRMDEQFKQWLDFGIDMSAMAQKSLTGLSPFTTVFKKSRDTEDNEKE
jgi:polyhydroxyalkanoate synthesis regulator protein